MLFLNKIYSYQKEVILLSLGFLIFAIIGTISHEIGHLVAAKALGYNTTFHYGSLSFDNSELNNELDSIYIRNQFAIDNELPYDEKKKFERKYDKLASDELKVLLAGPIQTIITGLIGFQFLIFRKKKIKENGLKLLDWVLVFLSLFWLREIFNLILNDNKKNKSKHKQSIIPDDSYSESQISNEENSKC